MDVEILRKHRKLVKTVTLIHFKLLPSNQLPRNQLYYLVKQLELLNEMDLSGLKAYNYSATQ